MEVFWGDLLGAHDGSDEDTADKAGQGEGREAMIPKVVVQDLLSFLLVVFFKKNRTRFTEHAGKRVEIGPVGGSMVFANFAFPKRSVRSAQLDPIVMTMLMKPFYESRTLPKCQETISY